MCHFANLSGQFLPLFKEFWLVWMSVNTLYYLLVCLLELMLGSYTEHNFCGLIFLCARRDQFRRPPFSATVSSKRSPFSGSVSSIRPPVLNPAWHISTLKSGRVPPPGRGPSKIHVTANHGVSLHIPPVPNLLPLAKIGAGGKKMTPKLHYIYKSVFKPQLLVLDLPYHV